MHGVQSLPFLRPTTILAPFSERTTRAFAVYQLLAAYALLISKPWEARGIVRAAPRRARLNGFAMANRFERWMEHHVSGHGVDSDLRVTKDGAFVTEQESRENPDVETESPYQADDEHLKEWIELLRHCGGFEVW